jgi:hypothetical protein
MALEAEDEKPPTQFDELRAWATDRADDWYLTSGTDRLAFDGLCPGRNLRVDAFNIFFSIALRTAGLASDLDQRGIRAWLKQRGFDRAARAWAMRALAVAVPRQDRADVVLVSEHATPSALLAPAAIVENWTSVRVGALAADPRALRFWWSKALPARPLVTSVPAERRLLASARDQFTVVWRRFEAEPPSLTLHGVDVSTTALAELRRQLIQSVPWLFVERAAVREALDQLRPAVLLLASDQHRIASIVVDESRARGIKTVVMQHGLPQHAVGYVPVSADRVMTWSEQSTNWFVARGTPRSVLTVTGNPAMDRPWLEQSLTSHSRSDRALLLALTPATRTTNAGVVAMALDALALLPDARLVVKLHPGDGDWHYVRGQVAEHFARDRVQVAHKEPLGPLLLGATVTWLHRSSVALESLAIGVPVIVTAQAAPSTADLELRELRLPVATSAADLARLSEAVFDDPERAAYFTKRPVESFTGPLDGGATARARDVILGMASHMQEDN